MKTITLLIHSHHRPALADLLRTLPGIPIFTFTAAEGHGQQEEDDPRLSARDRVVGYTPCVRVDIVLEDGQVDAVLEALRQSNIGQTGHGWYWVTSLEQHGRL